jgi:hypothetical protein
MADNKNIKTALISVFHKDGLDALLAKLHSEGVSPDFGNASPKILFEVE